MTPENRIKWAIFSYLSSIKEGFFFPIDSVGIYDPVKKTFRKRHSIYHVKGVSDILGVVRGRPIAIEVKSKVGRASPEQKSFIARFNASGGYAIVARHHDEVKKWLNEIFPKLT